MKDLNTVAFTGRLTADAQVKSFENGGNIISFSIAVNTSTKVNGQWTDYANFFEVKYSCKNADFANFLKKGTPVSIQGELKQDRWEKEGQKNSRVVINADFVKLEGKKSDGSAEGSSQNSSDNSSEFPEDIPF